MWKTGISRSRPGLEITISRKFYANFMFSHMKKTHFTYHVKTYYSPRTPNLDRGPNNVVLKFEYWVQLQEIVLWSLFHLQTFIHNSNLMAILPCSNSITEHQIATNFCTWHDNRAAVPSANDYFTITWMKVEWNCHRIWITMEKSFMKRVPIPVGGPHLCI